MVKPGYKQTEVGEIPEDWELKNLSDITVKIIDNRGKTPPLSKNNEIELIETASISFVARSPNYYKITKFVSPNTYNQWFRAHPEPNDILISTVGEYSGASAFYTESRGTIAQNLIALRIQHETPSYVFSWTRSSTFRLQLSQVMMNQAQPSLRVPWLMNFKIPLPPSRNEQKTIAETLSDMDKLIASLENLIAKKRDIKTATMQQLLTGKKRLPGFGEGRGYKQTELGQIPEDWDVVELGGISIIEMGQSPSSANYNTKGLGLPLIQGNADISDRKTIIRNHTTQVTKLAKTGDIILSVRAPVGEVAIALFECCIGRGVCAIRYKNDYLYHWLISFESSWNKFSKGSTFDSINSEELKDIKLSLPTNKKEQLAIAMILSDLDNDIAGLNKKLEKTKSIKQGMMQELLTGRTRLIKPLGTVAEEAKMQGT